MTFYRDLKSGKEVEYKHLEIIRKKFPLAHVVEGYCKEWDIFIPEKNIGVEIKSDKMSQKTGNIVVEISFNGKPSALSTTKAKYWIFDTDVEVITVETDELRKLVRKFKPTKFIGKGDSVYKNAYLIKIEHIRNISTTLDYNTGLDDFL